jgi:predicted TIM-barrel fold metal-dependent hydrolase
MSDRAHREIDELRLRDWRPASQLRAHETHVARPAVPAIDVHNHLGRWLTDGDWMIPDVRAFVDLLDDCGVQTVVNLDGMSGDELTDNVERYDRAHPGRFLTFAQLDWARLAQPGGVAALCAVLDDAVRRGARGLKVWKNLGLGIRDSASSPESQGALILPDDPRVIEVVAHAGELGMPALIHTADPIAFFEPLDERNERLDELRGAPDWWFGDRDRYPSFDRLLEAHAALVLACPGTTFIGAHVGGAAEDLDRVERLLAAAPNYTVDLAGRLAELGRQPRRTARLIADFPDRVLFGTDAYPATAGAYRLHFRFLESADEGFEYDPGAEIPSQGRWAVSALDLDPALLPALYRDNAARVLGLGA